MTLTHPDPAEVLGFWFADTARPDADLDAALIRWFRASPEFDREVAARYEALIHRAGVGELDRWAEDPRGRLALIVVLDQLPRNAFRDTPAAFVYDDKARRLCREGLAAGADRDLAPVQRHFFYLPLLHSEERADQEQSVACFERLAAAAPACQAGYFSAVVAAAHRYHGIIARFGRFPHRNPILGRASTPAEEDFLAASTPRWERGPRTG